MTQLKTQKNAKSVEKFISSIRSESKQSDCRDILAFMQKITKREATMWGDSMVGYGSYHYKYASGKSGEWFLCGFSPRAQNITIYIMNGFSEYADLLNNLGKYKTSKSCLYIKKLEDIDIKTLQTLIKKSVAYMRKNYKCD